MKTVQMRCDELNEAFHRAGVCVAKWGDRDVIVDRDGRIIADDDLFLSVMEYVVHGTPCLQHILKTICGIFATAPR